MTLIAIGLLLGSMGLLWITVISIIRGDRYMSRRDLRDPRGPVVDRLPDDKKAA